MKKKVVSILIMSLVLAMLAGCGNDSNSVDITMDNANKAGVEEADTASKEATDDLSINSLLGKTSETENITETNQGEDVDKDLTVAKLGDYGDIFSREVKTQVENKDISIVISGYEFDVDDDTYCTYFDSVGPAFQIGDQVQYKIKVQDRTNEEIKKIDVTEKVINLGGKVTDGPKTIVDGDIDYIVFEYELDGEKGVAINMPGPDPNHAIGVQLAFLDNSVKSDEAVRAAMVVAKTARKTTKPDTTKEEIKNIYGNSWVSGTTVKNATISLNGKTYAFTVPEGYKKTWENVDEDNALQFYSNGEISVAVTLSAREYESTKHYMDVMWEWKFADIKSDITLTDDQRVAYGTYEDKEPVVMYGVEGGMVVEGVGSVCIDGECETRKISIEDIIGFFDNESGDDNKESSAIGPKTCINYDQIYMGKVDDTEVAWDMIAEYGRMQRKNYSNPEVEKIEQRLQDKYDICAVNLGEMDIQTARDVEKAVTYMFETYPIMKGSLNTISLANLNRDESSFVAVTRTADFVIQDEIGDVPKLVRNEILLNAGKWLDRDKLLSMCKENVSSGYWFKNANDPSKVVVHELGHQLFNVLRAKEYNFYEEYNGKKVYMPCVLDDDNKEAYLEYYWSGTAMNQEYDTKIMDAAYKEWKSMGHTGSQEDMRKSISQYAQGIKSDGGVSLHETFAEAIADVYCNGENASDASKAIVKQVEG